MDLLGNFDALTKTLIGAVTLVGVFFSFLRWVRPMVRRWGADVRAGRDALVGREAVHDSITGRVIAPALPGIGVRMDTMETQQAVLTDAVAKLANSTVRLDDLDIRVKRLEVGVVERIVTKSESAAAWRAVEAVANGTPPPDDTALSTLGEN